MIEKSRREYLLYRIKDNSVLRDNGCIEWTATKNNQGYGIIHFAKSKGEGWLSSTTAHRAHYMVHHNVILTRWQFVCHTCDNPACINIEHLFLGTQQDNMKDKIAKGRHAKHYAPHSRVRVHSDDTIRAIREAMGTTTAIAKQFNVSLSYVSKIRNNKAKQLI